MREEGEHGEEVEALWNVAGCRRLEDDGRNMHGMPLCARSIQQRHAMSAPCAASHHARTPLAVMLGVTSPR